MKCPPPTSQIPPGEKTIALISSNKCKHASSAEMFLLCCTVHRDVLCISIMCFLCEQATLWNSSQICFIFPLKPIFSSLLFPSVPKTTVYRQHSHGAVALVQRRAARLVHYFTQQEDTIVEGFF